MKILHIIKNPNDITPIEIAKAQGGEHDVAHDVARDVAHDVAHDVALLLLHDAVYLDSGLKAYACADDAEARGVTAHERVGYDRIIKMLFEYDRVVSW